LLGDIHNAPLASLNLGTHRFEWHGVPMAPLEITTAQFGQQWGGCKAVSPLEVTSSSVSNLDAFMEVCSKVGAHKVEAIVTTNEGICAGMLGGTHVVLIHGKVSPGGVGTKLNVTVKSTDPGVTGPLAMYMQTMLR
jgi:Adaptin AP4 complex epsilon appendage platform